MPNLDAAKKAIRVSGRKRLVNDRRRKAMKEAVKGVRKVAETKDTKNSAEALRLAYKAIDKAAKRGVIKKNTAARKKARVAKALSTVSK